jgi:hypothetical protein
MNAWTSTPMLTHWRKSLQGKKGVRVQQAGLPRLSAAARPPHISQVQPPIQLTVGQQPVAQLTRHPLM